MSLRSNLIRLAHEQPELREHLLPILASRPLSDLAVYYLDQAAFTGSVPFGYKERAAQELLDAKYVKPDPRQHWAGRDLLITPAGRKAAKSLRAMGRTALGWKSLPKGWTQDSVDSFWGKLTGDVKHKVTKCIKRMEKHMGDGAGGFCASLADQVEGSTDWRKGPRKKKGSDLSAVKKGELPFYRGGGPLKRGSAYFISSEMMAKFYGAVVEYRIKLRKPKFVSQSEWTRFDSTMLRMDPSPIQELEEGGYDSAVWATTTPQGRMFTVFALDGTRVAKTAKSAAWVSRDDVRRLCPSCADKMASLGMTKIRTAALQAAFERASNTGKLKIRNDLKPRRPRGRSTNPNTYGDPTYYEVVALGDYEENGGFGPHDKRDVVRYLSTEGVHEPGHQYGGHGTEYNNTLKWDNYVYAWILESRFSSLGG
jgi:hypothetical protein